MILMGSILSGIAYGASLLAIQHIWPLTVVVLFVGIVFAICVFVLIMSSSGGYVTGLAAWRPLLTCWLLILATVSTVLQIRWTLLAFVTQRQDVSPSVFIERNINNPINVMLCVL